MLKTFLDQEKNQKQKYLFFQREVEKSGVRGKALQQPGWLTFYL